MRKYVVNTETGIHMIDVPALHDSPHMKNSEGYPLWRPMTQQEAVARGLHAQESVSFGSVEFIPLHRIDQIQKGDKKGLLKFARQYALDQHLDIVTKKFTELKDTLISLVTEHNKEQTLNGDNLAFLPNDFWSLTIPQLEEYAKHQGVYDQIVIKNRRKSEIQFAIIGVIQDRGE